MEMATDVIILVLSSVNNDLLIYISSAGVSSEIKYVGITGLKNILYITARVTCTINFSVKEIFCNKLKRLISSL